MTVQTKVVKPAQSLLGQCASQHWKLIQLFAEAETAMARKLGASSPETFGHKLNELGDKFADRPTRLMLIGARNLVAHAHISTVERDGEWLSCWTVADAKCGLDTRLMSEAFLKSWSAQVRHELLGLLDKLGK